MELTKEASSDNSEPPSSRPEVPSRGVSGVARNLTAGTLSAAFSWIHKYPLFVGVFLLVGISALSTGASYGALTFTHDGAIGGEVEVVEYDYGPSPADEVYTEGASPFELSGDVYAMVSASDDDGVVTVPTTPTPPPGASQREPYVYEVEEGDTLGRIAVQYGVTTAAIAYSNKIYNYDAIAPGENLKIPPVEGVIHTVAEKETLNGIAKKYKANADKILAFNGLPADGSVLAIGYELVVPDGEPPAPPKPKVIARYAGPSYAQNPVPYGYFISPTTGRITRGVTYYHKGVDIANSRGTPIYAAAAGTVTRSDAIGWNGGYGKVIYINHPNGVQTRYAHNSQLLVQEGEAVAQGQLIALMGTTGRSSGYHLHFETIGAKNPIG